MAFRSNLPGETPLDDYSGLKQKWITNQGQLNQAEFENCLEAVEKYLSAKPNRRTAPFARTWMLKVHKEMFGKVWKWAGKTRGSEKNIGVLPCEIRMNMEDLALDLAVWHEVRFCK